MSLHPSTLPPVPEETARIAKLAFPNGNRYLTLRDQVGTFFNDSDFKDLFSVYGQSAISPCQLALICIMQFLEDLTDRQAAEAVRSRIDWKYLLGLELTDAGFDYSVLCEFRTRLIDGNAEARLLNVFLDECKRQGWIKQRGKQRTDSTHVLAATRDLNRLECVGETLRAALNSIATIAPEWLQDWVPLEWFDRYSRAIEEYHLPKGIAARKEYAEVIGADGMELLEQVWEDTTAPLELRHLPAVDILRRTWVHQYQIVEGQVRLRDAKNIPPAGERIDSPYDPDARFGNKRSTTWTGYKVHWTETCDDGQVHLITHVMTTHGHQTDIGQTEEVHKALEAKSLLPAEHLVDTAYVNSPLLLNSEPDYGITLIGPMRPNVSWQANSDGYDLSMFRINWKAQKVTCPQGKKSRSWSPGKDMAGRPIFHVKFAIADCRRCAQRSLCTRCKDAPRHLMIRPQQEHKALEAIRRQQQTKKWKKRYDKRAGVEGTLATGIQVLGLRRTRYIGLTKTHLQHVFTAIAMNFARIVSWLKAEPLPKLRVSRFAVLAPA